MSITFKEVKMLQSLEIKNYRNLKDLKINSLSRINLITGKNNTGKSTLLEAISLYASKCDLPWIVQLLDERGENYKPSENDLNSAEASIKAFSCLFSNRNIKYSVNDSISIGAIEETLFGEQTSATKSISIRFVKYVNEIESIHDGPDHFLNRRKRTIIQEEDFSNNIADFHIGLGIRDSSSSYILPLENERIVRINYRSTSPADNFQLIRHNIDREINGKLWDAIALTEKEVNVIEGLRIIEANIERLAYVGDNARNRTIVVKLKDDNNVVPLKSMGDGINRILTIILALVNADNGYLLIDEFENGLHYSVQEKLWEIIFKLSQSLNIQVFATTHSEDCIRAFESVLNQNQEHANGKLIRLDNINGIIKQTEFNASELKTASENNIETR